MLFLSEAPETSQMQTQEMWEMKSNLNFGQTYVFGASSPCTLHSELLRQPSTLFPVSGCQTSAWAAPLVGLGDLLVFSPQPAEKKIKRDQSLLLSEFGIYWWV